MPLRYSLEGGPLYREVVWWRARIEISKNSGDISPKYRLLAVFDTIFVIDYRSMEIFENISDISVFVGIFTDFSGNFPIFPTSPARAQDTKSVQFFLEQKHKMLFSNLIMICRQRLCFSAWLKNRGFRVHEI